MAIANYQLPNKLTFYPSYALYCYANGLIQDAYTNTVLPEEELYRLIGLNPTNILGFGDGDYIKYTINPKISSDFFMVLGHNLVEASQTLSLFADDEEIPLTPVVNSVAEPEYNGWSLDSIVDSTEYENFEIKFSSFGEQKIGCFLWGRKFQCPQNVDLSQSHKISYGYKAKKSISGKSMSTLNYSKANKWLMDPWELDEENSDTRNINTHSRNGIRTWKVSMTMLQDSKMMSQNNMLNNNNWTADSLQEYENSQTIYNSTYNTNNSPDFYSSVIKMTMGGHLPCVVNISDSKNSDQWAIVKISDYNISQNNPKLVNIKLTLEEQV